MRRIVALRTKIATVYYLEELVESETPFIKRDGLDNNDRFLLPERRIVALRTNIATDYYLEDLVESETPFIKRDGLRSEEHTLELQYTFLPLSRLLP